MKSNQDPDKNRDFTHTDPRLWLQQDVVRQAIRDRAGKADWWTFVYESADGVELAERIKEAHYADAAQADYLNAIMVLPNAGASAGVCLARQSRMSRAELLVVLSDWGAVSPERLAKQIMFIGEISDGVKEWFWTVSGVGENE